MMSRCNQESVGPVENPMVGDYFNSVPHDIPVNILSLLNIKDAVRTSALSKDWKKKWMSINNIDIDVKDFFLVPRAKNSEIFVDFVKGILAHKHNLKGFHIKISDYGKYIPSEFSDWISAALERKVEKLQITMSRNDLEKYPTKEQILYFNSHSCSSLENLEVVMRCTFKVVTRDCFTKLVSLILDNVIFESDDDTDTMVLNFPVMRELDLDDCKWWKMEVVVVHAPLLSIFRSAVGIEDACEIKIVASNLEKIFTALGPPGNITLTSSPVYACLECHMPNDFEYEDCGIQIRKLFGELSRVKKMHLLGFLKAIAVSKQELPIQRLTELEELKVAWHINVEGLLELLHASPNLNFLCIEFENRGYGNDYPDYSDYDYGTIESVPPCLISRLQKVELDYSDCVGRPNLNFAKFLLKDGAQLKNVYVCGSRHFPASEIVDELLTFPKGSMCLRIECLTCTTSF